MVHGVECKPRRRCSAAPPGPPPACGSFVVMAGATQDLQRSDRLRGSYGGQAALLRRSTDLGVWTPFLSSCGVKVQITTPRHRTTLQTGSQIQECRNMLQVAKYVIARPSG